MSLKLGLAALAVSVAALTGCQTGGTACVGYQGHGQRVCPTYSGCAPSPCGSPCYSDPCATGYYGGQLLTPNPATAHLPGTPAPATRPAQTN